MASERKRLFCIRFHPTDAPPSIVGLLATSASEAEKLAQAKAKRTDAPVSVVEIPDGEAMLVTFPAPRKTH